MNPGKSTKLIEHDDEQNLIFSKLCASGSAVQGGASDNRLLGEFRI